MVFAASSEIGGNSKNSSVDGKPASLSSLEKQVVELQKKVATIEASNKVMVGGGDPLAGLYSYGPAVVTSPALGVRCSAEDSSDLMVRLSSINEDLALLNLRKKMSDYARKQNIEHPERPIISLSGKVEAQVIYSNDLDFKNRNETDVNLSAAELDIIASASPWATAAMVISYEDSQAEYSRRARNSRLKLDRGFLTIGQLEKFPLYLTMGQIFAPFGSYSSYMINDPLTKLVGRVKDRMVVLGYAAECGLSAQAYGLPGEIDISSGHNFIEHLGANLAYNYTNGKFKLLVASSFIGNIAESEKMLDRVFNVNNRSIVHRVNGIDGRIKASYGDFTLLAEYVGAIRNFDASDLSFNGVGAKPQAMSAEGAINFMIKSRPSTLAFGYSHSWESLALQIPRDSFFTSYNLVMFKNTVMGIEYRHDVNYGKHDVATGKNNLVKVGGERHSNVVTLQLGVYF